MNSITSESVGKLSLDDIVSIVPAIYKEKDTYRSVWDIWLHATHHGAAIGEELRKYKPGKKLLTEIADFSMWLFTFAEKIEGKFEQPAGENERIGEFTIKTEMRFSEIIWNKYPKVCPVCFWRRTKSGLSIVGTCDCLLYDVEDRDRVEGKEAEAVKNKEKRERVKALREYAKNEIKNKPNTIDEWQNAFGELYKANLRHSSLVDIGFHLLEEVGEVSDAMVRMYTYKGSNLEPRLNQIWLEEEIADVFSWLNTLVNSLQIIPDISKEFLDYLNLKKLKAVTDDKIWLSQIIWHGYGSEEQKKFYCPHCGKPKCECDISLIGENVLYSEFLKAVNKDPLN